MTYSVVATKIDPLTKKLAQETAEELGMPLSVIIKAFLKQFIKTKTVTFSARDEEPSEYLKTVIKQAEESIKMGKHSPVLKAGKDAVIWLNKQGI